MRSLTWIVVLLSAAPSIGQTACDKFVRLDPEQLREDYRTLEDPAASRIDQIIAFTNLRCSDEASVRDLALRAGSVSENGSLRAAVLWDAIAQRAVLSMDLLEIDGMTDAHYERLDTAPTVELGIDAVFPERSCFSLNGAGACSNSYALVVNGTQVDFTHNNIGSGTFELGPDGVLSGTVTLKPMMKFPARIALF